MKLGLFTACLGGVPLDKLAPWAAHAGFETLELAAWPDEPDAPRHVGAERFTHADARHVRETMDAHGLTISALGYYDNPLHPNGDVRRRVRHHLRAVVDAAAQLDVGLVGTFVGARPDRSPAENLREIGTYFREFVTYAGDRGVRVMIENCPMLNWVQFGLPGNYAYSPELWSGLFDEVPDPGFGLNLDPSHLHWLGIDVERVVRDYAGRIFHAHAKDTEMRPEGMYRYGRLGRQLGDNPWDSGWWRYRLPGLGEIDWRSFIGTLREAGYDGVLSIEHEDPEYEGAPDRIRDGLRLGLDHLKACRNAEG